MLRKRISILTKNFDSNFFVQSLEANLHALMKVAGAEAESSRPDRNSFIKVKWDNVYEDDSFLEPLLRAGDPAKPGRII